MKKHFPGYYDYTNNELTTIWEKGFFVFDTCVLLNIYYLSSQKKVFLSILDNLKGRIKLPYHIAEEYHRNVFHKINEQYQHFNDIKNKVDQLRTCIQDGSRQGLWDSKDEKKQILEQISSVDTKINKIQNNNLYADLRSRIADLFTPALCEELTPEDIEKIAKKTEKGFKDNSTPGYKDKNKTNGNNYGDSIIWQSLQNIAIENKAPIIFVTEDLKRDWFFPINNIHYSRPDWINEFILKTKQHFLIYTLGQFIDNYSKYITKNKEKLSELKSEITAAQNARQNDNENTDDNQVNNTDSKEDVNSSNSR